MTVTPPIVVRLFEPISLLFPGNAMPSLRATVPPPSCILCDGPASPPSRMGWLGTPERQEVFCVCGRCSDCEDAELEKRIVAQVSGADEPIIVPAKEEAWVARAAKDWVGPPPAPRP